MSPFVYFFLPVLLLPRDSPYLFVLFLNMVEATLLATLVNNGIKLLVNLYMLNSLFARSNRFIIRDKDRVRLRLSKIYSDISEIVFNYF